MKRLSMLGVRSAGLLVVILITAFAGQAAAQTQILVAKGSIWKYWAQGSQPASGWQSSVGFVDSAWASGAAKLGYGDGDEKTVVGYGPDADDKFVSTYFRRTFDVSSPSSFSALTVNIRRDDGAVVYLNGTEIYRAFLPAGASYGTYATAVVGGADETTFFSATAAASLLVAGTNLISVEIHQANASSSDLSFDLELLATQAAAPPPTGPTITRGPYLQMATPTSMVVRWRTSSATASRVSLGAAANSLNVAVDDAASTTEHLVRVTGLVPATKYFYGVGSSTNGILAGADANHFFSTPPLAGTVQNTRIWVLGDAGTGTADQGKVRDAFKTFTGNRQADLIMALGDNAYDKGLDSEYQTKFFRMYPEFFRQVPLWSALGNHETGDTTAPATPPAYFDVFTFPTAGEAGGQSSGTENYYAFNHANIHFIVLDSMLSSRAKTAAMYQWATADLAANTQPWIVGVWHHPPYSKGSHDSDATAEIAMTEMRTVFAELLEKNGVDLVLTGHSHAYERSYLQDGHYGVSSTYDKNAHRKNWGDGRVGGNGAYFKTASGKTPNEGAVYVVSGSAGKISGGTLNHPAMYRSINVLGSVVVDVSGSQMDVSFLRDTGAIDDSFRIVKGQAPPAKPDAPTVAATAVSQTQIDLSWTDPSTDELGFSVERAVGAGAFSQLAALAPNTTRYQSTGLTSGTAYSYRVRAFNVSGNGGYSAAATATTAAPNPTAAPSAPSALSVATGSATQLNLSWKDNANNETGFKIERSPDAANWTQIATVAANATSYQNTGLNTTDAYHYRVRATNTGGDSAASNTASVLIRQGATWQYLDNGTNQGTAFYSPTFAPSSAWKTGRAELGYGDGDETTVLGYGPSSAAKFITSYFRQTFAASSGYASIVLRFRRDDGVVIYLNGKEIGRSNMPSGVVSYTTLASSAASDDGATWQTLTVNLADLKPGATNLLAAELHQSSGSSSDSSFAAELIAK